MNKRFLSILLCIALILTMSMGALPVYASNNTSFTVSAAPAEAHPGDTITFTVSLGAVTDLAAINFEPDIPAGLTVEMGAAPTEFTVKGMDKCLVGQFADKIHKVRKADPYKGKGIFYKGEQIRRKEGKKK